MLFKTLRDKIIGAPRDPFDKGTRKRIALVAFFAWIGLGADGLSSSAYGPAEAFLALGTHHHLAFYLAILTAFTVFIIALAYNQVIELFPTGGGGYKVASKLLGPKVGLFSGSALVVDYVLTIAISISGAIDALFSLLPTDMHHYQLHVKISCLFILLFLNLRGMKESIKILMPLFLGFLITHFFLIAYGIGLHGSELPDMLKQNFAETQSFIGQAGLFAVLALFLRAYSLGAGTYTGIEAVSNNVNHLAEPRVHTGKWTMFYMAVSLSLTAGGIILLYLLWNVEPQYGKTLNAVVFAQVLEGIPFSHLLLILALTLEAGLLFVAANTGFLGGPSVLANMSLDGWTPKGFRNLSSRLVTQNGIIFFGIFAAFILLWTRGNVAMLVVLYSINVFITFSLSLLGLCVYWIKHRTYTLNWFYRLALSVLGLIVCASILTVTLLEKFLSGGWLTLLVTSSVVIVCLIIKRHYRLVAKQVRYLDKLLTLPIDHTKIKTKPEIDPEKPTAIFLIGESIGQGMHTLLWVQRMFPGYFKNFIFLSVGVIDVGSYGSEASLKKLKLNMKKRMQYFIDFSNQRGFAATSYIAYDSDPVNELVKLSDEVSEKYPHAIFFSALLISKQHNWFYRKLHSDIPNTLQHHLHLQGKQMVILPVKLERNVPLVNY
jgi:amino acid transporter